MAYFRKRVCDVPYLPRKSERKLIRYGVHADMNTAAAGRNIVEWNSGSSFTISLSDADRHVVGSAMSRRAQQRSSNPANERSWETVDDGSFVTFAHTTVVVHTAVEYASVMPL